MSIHSRAGAALVCAIAVLCVSSAFAGTNSWSIKGPPGGAFRDVKASSTEANVFYAAYLRSLHKSSDGGANWVLVREFDGQVNGLAVDPADGKRLYVSVFNHGVFRSEDGGASFALVSPSTFAWGIGASASSVYYSTGTRAILRSVDHGETWEARGVASQTLNRILVDPQSPDTVIGVAGWLLLRSTDGGVTWSQSAINATATIYDIAQLSATQFVAALFDGLYASGDAGVTWTRTSAGAFRAIVADSTAPGRAVAAPFGGGYLLATTDHGANWSPLGASSPSNIEGLSIDSQSSARMVVLNQQDAQFTTNAGASWSIAPQSPIASSVTQIVTTVANASKLYTYTTGSGDGLFSTSQDAGWTRLNLSAAHALSGGSPFGQARLAVKPGTPDTIFIGAFNRGVFRSFDGGTTWGPTNGDLNGYSVQAFGFDPQDANVMYANVSQVTTTPANGLYRSTDGGASWVPHSTNLATNLSGMDLQIDPANGSRMYLAVYQGYGPSNSGGLYRSNDRGVSWDQIAFTGEDVRVVAIDPANTSTIHVATTSGLQTSTNGGDTFSPNAAFAAITGRGAATIAVDPVIPSTLYAASYESGDAFAVQPGSHVLRSVDSGQSWEVLQSPSNASIWHVLHLALDPNVPSLLYASTGTRGIATFEVAPDLSIVLSGHAGERALNAESTFNVVARNNGPLAATGVRLNIVLPHGLDAVSIASSKGTCTGATSISCAIPVLRVGEMIEAVVKYTPRSSILVPVTTSIAGHERDAVSANNSVQASAFAGQVVDLGVTLTATSAAVTRGSTIGYTANVTNAGPSDANGATLAFALGAGLTVEQAPDGCTKNGAAINCTLSTLAPSATRTISFAAIASEVGTSTTTATVAPSSSEAEASPTNNSATLAVATSEPPVSQSGNPRSGGGGGAFDWFVLQMLLLLALTRMREAFAHSGPASAAQKLS